MKAEFARFTLLKLYTDTVPLEYYSSDKIKDTKKAIEDRQTEDADAHKQFQQKRFGTSQLPLYAIIEPVGDDFKVIAAYPLAVIREESDFVAFLQKHALPQLAGK